MVVLELTQIVAGLVSEPVTWRLGGRSTDAQAIVKLRLDGR
jgi:hypothetical protein